VNDSNRKKINPNTADIETLTQIPGIGRELALRIIAARPFEDLSELRRVSGIGSASMDRYSPYLTLSTEEIEPEQPVVTYEAEVEIQPETEALPEDETPQPVEEIKPDEEAVTAAPVLEPAAQASTETQEQKPEPQSKPDVPKEKPQTQPAPPEKTAPKVQPDWITRNQAVGLVFVGFLLALFLGLLLSLGILAGINRGQLQFAVPAQINELKVQADRLDSRTGAIEQDIQGMRERMDNMEMLGSRVTDIEKDTKQLSSEIQQLASDMENLSSEVSSLSDEVNGFGTQIETLQTQGEQFMGFLDGLRALLENLGNPQEGNK